MKRKNVTCVKELFNCIALMSATSFVGLPFLERTLFAISCWSILKATASPATSPAAIPITVPTPGETAVPAAVVAAVVAVFATTLEVSFATVFADSFATFFLLGMNHHRLVIHFFDFQFRSPPPFWA